MIETGEYRAVRMIRIKLGFRKFTIEKGEKITVCSYDKKHKKIMIKINSIDVDWISENLLVDFTRV